MTNVPVSVSPTKAARRRQPKQGEFGGRGGGRGFRVFQYVATFGSAAVISFPIYWLVVTSLKPSEDMFPKSIVDLVPHSLTLDHYWEVLFGGKNFFTYFSNSLMVAGSTTLITLVVATLGAYALARLSFPGSRWLGRSVLFAYVIPPVLLVIPVFSILLGLGLYNSLFGLTLAHVTFAVPFALWLLRAYFSGSPVELEQAGMIDGLTRLGVVRRIVLPLAGPGLVAVSIFTFMLSWNDYLYALVLLTDDAVRTLPIGLNASFMNHNMSANDWGNVMAASVLSAIPVFVAYLVLQRWLVGGLAAGAVKQ